jgi:hypothetical protein
MELLGDVGHVVSCLGPLGDGVSIGERLVHGLHHTHLGLEIILDVIDGTPGDEAQVEAHFSPFGDSVNLDSR